MKIHLDYLEGKVEELENANMKLTNEKKTFPKKLTALEDKLKQLQIQKDREVDVLK